MLSQVVEECVAIERTRRGKRRLIHSFLLLQSQHGLRHGSVFSGLQRVSTSGATLFIEPLAVVELANQWRALQSAAAAEERRILLELSALVGAQATAVRMLVQLLAELDLALAKGTEV